MNLSDPKFHVGQRVFKATGEYQAFGTIVAVGRTSTGTLLYMFEFDIPRGMVHVFREHQLQETQML